MTPRTLLIPPLVATLLAGCMPTGDHKGSTNVPDPATGIDWREVSAVSKDQTEALRTLLSDSSFLVRMVWGRDYVHFAPGGQAWFWNTRDRRIETGTWDVLEARFGTDFVCWARGGLPDPMAGKALVDHCRPAAEFLGVADYLSRGDVFGLKAGHAPE